MFVSNTSDSTTSQCYWLYMIIMISKKNKPGVWFCHVTTSCAFSSRSPFTIGVVWICRACVRLPATAVASCLPPERAISTWRLTFTRHPSDAELGSRQTTRICAHWDAGEERAALRDAGRARQRQDRGGDRRKKKKKKKATHLWIFMTRGQRRAPHIN